MCCHMKPRLYPCFPIRQHTNRTPYAAHRDSFASSKGSKMSLDEQAVMANTVLNTKSAMPCNKP